MPKIVMRSLTLATKAFTLWESLLVLSILTTTLIVFSVPISSIYSQVEEKLFFIEFENFYRHCQKQSLLRQEEKDLYLGGNLISYGHQELTIPEGVRLLSNHRIRLNKLGGNHSLAKIKFETSQRQITYQLNLGSGNYQKTSR